jgi:phytanoyl-CoA hydroxylase
VDLSDEQLTQFDREGFVIIDQIISPTRVDRLAQAMDRVYGGQYNRDIRPAGVRKPLAPFGTERSVRWILNSRLVDGEIWDTATDPELGAAAARLLRTPAVSIIEDQLLDKPDQGVPVNLHQDYSYWRFSTSVNMMTCWIALSDMSAEVGPVELVRGSHRWGFAARPRELIHGSDDEYLGAATSVIQPGQGFEFVSAVVPKGGGVFFHGLTFHGSRGNSTGRLRRAMSLHWAGADCRLDRTQLADYDHPYMFTGLRQGDRLANRYIPQVYPV